MTTSATSMKEHTAPPSWRTLVDIPALTAWMDLNHLGHEPIADVRPLGGGTQNLLLAFRRGKENFVLRRPPEHSLADGNDTMRREARITGALAGTGVPHPRLIAACGDPSVLGVAFYLMEPVDGFNANVALPPRHAADPAIRNAMGLAIVDAAAELGRLDPVACGLGDLVRPGFLARQPARWQSQLDSYGRYPDWPGPAELGNVAAISRWLEAHLPTDGVPGIMHGDYHLANVMFRNDGPELAAIVDWELATVGDPLVDLGWLLATWPDPLDCATPLIAITPWDGFPDPQALIARYCERSDRDLTAITWYAVFACYKLAILIEGTHARASACAALRATGDHLHAAAVDLIARAHRWMRKA